MVSSVSVVIPCYRDAGLLARTLPRLLASQGVTSEVILVNNDPSQRLDDLVNGPRVRLLQAGRNQGYAGAMNLGIAAATGDAVLLGNDDLFVTPGFLASLAAELAARPGAGSVCGRLLRYDLAAAEPLPTIDSAGIAGRRSRGAFDRGQGEPDDGRFLGPARVFGGSGAAVMVRRAALDDVSLDGKVFDERFFMYKEDVDLAWRLRRRGWDCWYVPAAVAYHGRTSSGSAEAYLAAPGRHLRAHGRKNDLVRLHSMKNQWLLLVRHETPATLVRDLPWILARELAVVATNLVQRPVVTFRALVATVAALPASLRWRRALRARDVVPPLEVRRWFAR